MCRHMFHKNLMSHHHKSHKQGVLVSLSKSSTIKLLYNIVCYIIPGIISAYCLNSDFEKQKACLIYWLMTLLLIKFDEIFDFLFNKITLWIFIKIFVFSFLQFCVIKYPSFITGIFNVSFKPIYEFVFPKIHSFLTSTKINTTTKIAKETIANHVL